MPAGKKREGDGATPIGRWPARRVYFRPDRGNAPETGLPVIALRPEDGWCDDAGAPLYNQLIPLPYRRRHERMWRDDKVYDLIVELGYNDDPPVSGKGSAIFLHVARGDYTPTEGCLALSEADLRAVLRQLGGGSVIEVKA